MSAAATPHLRRHTDAVRVIGYTLNILPAKREHCREHGPLESSIQVCRHLIVEAQTPALLLAPTSQRQGIALCEQCLNGSHDADTIALCPECATAHHVLQIAVR